eukprot:2696046-Amphidinium_carterae.1
MQNDKTLHRKPKVYPNSSSGTLIPGFVIPVKGCPDSEAITLQGAQQVMAILNGVKLIENRSWKIPCGWYALHAGYKVEKRRDAL